MKLGIDGGNDNVKIFGEFGEMKFPSVLGEYRERKLEQTFTDDDMMYEFKEKKGFAGTLAQFESQFPTSFMGDSKAHDDFLIRVLLGIHRYTREEMNPVVQIIVGQPISKMTLNEKKKMKNLLLGTHFITVNGIPKTITIEKAEISAEGGGAFWSSPKQGLVRILDIGSGTVNGATLHDGRYIDKDSFTIKEGLQTMLTDEIDGLVRTIAARAKRQWNVDDTVLLCGGGADRVLGSLREYFPSADLLRPKVQLKEKEGNGFKLVSLPPIYANAVGFYHIAKKVFP